MFPIQDFNNRASLQFVGYDLGIEYDVDECRERGMTFSAPLKVTVRLVVWNVDIETETRTVSNIKSRRSTSASSADDGQRRPSSTGPSAWW